MRRVRTYEGPSRLCNERDIAITVYRSQYARVGIVKMVACPNCGGEVEAPIEEWDLSPKVHVKMYQCCGKTLENT